MEQPVQTLTPQGQQRVAEIAQRQGVSYDAAVTLLSAVSSGGGSMAQFSHPELGGMGQWSRGGMIMVVDMFNHGLKARVDALCNDLAWLLNEPGIFAPPPPQSQGFFGQSHGNWWPDGLGSPASSGGQNDLRYAWFPGSRRLAIQQGGQVSLYDTGDHQIGGVSQQQGGSQSLTFSSQYGTIRVADLPRVDGQGYAPEPPPYQGPTYQSQPFAAQPFAPTPFAPQAFTPQTAPDGDVFATIEKLAGLRQKGVLSEEEFAAKKSELLSRL
jgi:hypothetical protein